jgi:hypothetical protein
MALLPPSTAGGGTVDHGQLTGRDATNSHPVGAITGLADWMEAQDAALHVSESLRFILSLNTTTQQIITLPPPSTTLSLALVMTRTSDGATIEPDITYQYGPGVRYIESVRLQFNPPLTGEYIVHIVR